MENLVSGLHVHILEHGRGIPPLSSLITEGQHLFPSFRGAKIWIPRFFSESRTYFN